LRTDGSSQTLQRFLQVAEPVVALFGAGHVGRAVAGALAPLPCQTWWVDERESEFPEILPDRTRRWVSADFEPILNQLPAGSFVLVMTHRHPLDYAICQAALARSDLAYVGLIGSITKKRRFQHQLGLDGLSESASKSLVCPIGFDQIAGKQPAVIAASVVAQLLSLFPSPPSAKRQGISHQDASASCVAGSF
jgi:xanthine dehydrogenase accessory factor